MNYFCQFHCPIEILYISLRYDILISGYWLFTSEGFPSPRLICKRNMESAW